MFTFPVRIASAWALVSALVGAAAGADTHYKLDAAGRTEAIHCVLQKIHDLYIFPEVGEKMVQAVRAKAARKEYDSIEDGQKLAAELTEDLQAAAKDKHVRVHFSPDVIPPQPPSPEQLPTEEQARMRRMLERINFGIPKVEVLTGNIGYVRIDLLAPPEFAGDTYAAAMNTVANTNGLILDLRNCGGAISPHAIPMLTGYFFAHPVHLIDMRWGRDGKPNQSWSAPYVPGKRYLEKPVYVLTSKRTFSGAEELAYDLRNLKRATIVGDVTGGGANPGGIQRANDHFAIFVPTGVVESPITKSNWEGVGVQPDVKIPEVEALTRTHMLALEKALASAKDDEEKQWLRDAAEEVARASR